MYYTSIKISICDKGVSSQISLQFANDKLSKPENEINSPTLNDQPVNKKVNELLWKNSLFKITIYLFKVKFLSLYAYWHGEN
jgi:hypothetical protein